MGRTRVSDTHCPICNSDYVDIGVVRDASMFGRQIGSVCLGCYSVPKNWEETPEGIVVFEQHDRKRLHTIQELMEDGWNQEEAKRHLNSVKKFFGIRIRK